jgi:hypothetical protein
VSTEPSPVHGDGETPEHLSPSPGEQPGRRRRRQLTAVAVAAGVLVAGGGGAYWASSAVHGGDRGDSAGKPPPLALDNVAAQAGKKDQAGGGTGENGGKSGGKHGIAPGEPSGAGPFKADGKLPDGPDSASVYRPGDTVSRDAVAGLAKALKVPGKPEKHGGDWVVGDGKDSGTLTVHGGDASSAGTWSYARKGGTDEVACASEPARRSGGGTSAHSNAASTLAACPGGPAGKPSAQKGEPISEKKARESVRPTLKAMHLGDASLDTGMAMGGLRMVNASPRVDGMPTQGWETMFTLDSGGRVDHAHGHLGTLDKGATYPVVSAKQGLRQLNRQATGAGSQHGGADDGAGRGGEKDDGKKFTIQSLGTSSSAKVSKAEFGLATQYSNGKPVLVPSWLYETVGESGPPIKTAATAVHPKYVKSTGGSGGSDTDSDAAAGSGAGVGKSPDRDGEGGKSQEHGSAPAPSHTKRPGSPPAQAASEYEAHGRTLKVTFWGGVCSGYKATADESAKSVKVTVHPKKSDSKKICVKMAKRQSVEVKLDKPLGDRKVVDGRDGDKLPALK